MKITFDGDQLNGSLSMDLVTAEEMQRLAPHMSTFNLKQPRTISKNLSMPKPVVSTIASWFEDEDDVVDPTILASMALIPEAPN